MKTKSRNRLAGAAAALLFTTGLVLPRAALSPATATNPGASISGAEETVAPSEQGGIKVHGHWTIEVRNSDGTLASHTEFENSLGFNGSEFLSKVLGRAGSVGEWRIRLYGGVCGGSLCELVENTDPFAPVPNRFKTLSFSIPTSGPNVGKIEILGNAIASTAGQITDVETLGTLCSNTTPPTTGCFPGAGGNQFRLTIATLASPIGIQSAQAIQVTVVISFS